MFLFFTEAGLLTSFPTIPKTCVVRCALVKGKDDYTNHRIVSEMWKGTKGKRRRIGALVILALFALILLKPSEQDLTIVFAGYTNSATGVQSANFIVRNVAGGIVFVSESGFVQSKKRGEWAEAAPTRSRVIGLQPGETFVVNVFNPTNGETWRVFLTSGRPRGSFIRRVGDIYERQPLQFEPLSYLLLSPVLRHTFSYSEEIPK